MLNMVIFVMLNFKYPLIFADRFEQGSVWSQQLLLYANYPEGQEIRAFPQIRKSRTRWRRYRAYVSIFLCPSESFLMVLATITRRTLWKNSKHCKISSNNAIYTNFAPASTTRPRTHLMISWMMITRRSQANSSPSNWKPKTNPKTPSPTKNSRYAIFDISRFWFPPQRAREVLEKGSKCTLDKRVADLVQLLFDTNMFKEQMEQMKIDTKKVRDSLSFLRYLQLPLDARRKIEQESNWKGYQGARRNWARTWEEETRQRILSRCF